MAVASEYSGWVKELDHYEASLDVHDDDGRVETSAVNRRPSSRGSTVGIGTGRKSKPSRPSVADELQQEMKLLNWHKLANEAALKAAIIKTNKIKTEDSRFANSLAFEDAEDKRQRIQQIIEEEQLRPLQVNTEFFRDFEAREQRDEVKVETDVQRHIQHLKKLKETMAQREDLHRRRQKYKEGMAELGGGLKSHSVPKGHKSNQEDEMSAHSNKRYQRSVSTAQRADAANAEVVCSLDKLMELEKRIRHLEDAGLGVDGLDGDGMGGDGVILEDIDDNNVTSTKNIRFSKRKSSGTSNEPSKTVYAVKTVTKARAKDYHSVAQSTASSAARKRSLSINKPKPQDTFLTSLPENKQRQLRRMTDRERRNFLKKEKASEVQQQQHKQDVVIQDWMQKKKQAAQQRKVTSHQATTTTASANAAAARRGAGKPLPPPPKVKAPLRGAAAGKHIANPHLQKFDDIRKGFDKRKEAMNKVPTTKNGGSNKVLDLRTPTHTKKPVAPGTGPSLSVSRGPPASSAHKPSLGLQTHSTSRNVPGASHMPSAPSNNQRRLSGDSHKLPAISRAPPAAVPSTQTPQFGLSNHRPGPGASHSSTSGSSSQSRSSAGLTLPKLSGVRGAVAMPSPPPASAKNPAMPQFSRLHKR